MDKLKYVKLENPDGSYGDSIPLSVDTDHVDIPFADAPNDLSNYIVKNNTDINNLKNADINLQSQITNNSAAISSLSNGSPLVASSVAGMTDTSKVYVNTTDGHWYYYNNGWQDGGVYEATSNATVVDLLNTTLINVNTDSSLWEKGGWNDSPGNRADGNLSGVRYKLRLPSYIKAVGLLNNISSYQMVLVSYLRNKETLSYETFVERHIYATTDLVYLDQDLYIYYIYLRRKPASSEITVEEAWNKLKFYADPIEINNNADDAKNIKKLSNEKLAEIKFSTAEDWKKDYLWNNDNLIYNIDGMCALDMKIPSTVVKIESNENCRFCIHRKAKASGSCARLYWYESFSDFNHTIYEYKIYLGGCRGGYDAEDAARNVHFYQSFNFDDDINTKIRDSLQIKDNYDLDYEYDADSNANYTCLRVYKTKIDGTSQYPFLYCPSQATGSGTVSTLAMMRSQTKGWIIGINAGTFNTSTHVPHGIVIENSIILHDAEDGMDGRKVLTISASGQLGYAGSEIVHAIDVLNSGVVSAVSGWTPIIDNYTDFDYSEVAPANYNDNAQRQIIGQWDNGDYAIITCEGRSYAGSDGWTMTEAKAICKKLGLKFAFNLDGGGSTETVIGKKQLNHIYDGSDGRAVPTYLCFNGTTSFDLT